MYSTTSRNLTSPDLSSPVPLHLEFVLPRILMEEKSEVVDGGGRGGDVDHDTDLTTHEGVSRLKPLVFLDSLSPPDLGSCQT